MTVRTDSAATDASVSRHDLLGGWRDVMKDVRRLSAQFRSIGALIDAALRFLPALQEVLEARGAAAAADHLTSVRSCIVAVERAFRRLASASAEFGQGCKSSHTKVVEELVDDLLRDVWELEELLEPGTPRWAELKPAPQRS